MSTFRNSLIKKNIWLYLFSFLIAPTGYIVKIILSGDISVEELGVLYGIISFVTVLSSYNDFGMTESMNYFLPEHLAKGDKKKTTQTLFSAACTQLVTSTILGVILFFGADWLAEVYFKSPDALYLVKIFILFFFGENLFKTLFTFFQAVQDTKLQKASEFIRMMTLVIYVVAIYMMDLGSLYTYAWGWIIALVVGVVVALVWLFTKYHHILSWEGVRIEKVFFKGLLSYAIWVVLTANAATILSQIDMQMIIAMLGPEEAGYYTNYLSIMRIPFMFLLPGVVFLFPVFSDLYKRGAIKTIQTIRISAYKYFSVLGVMTGGFFFVMGVYLSIALFGEVFEKSGQILLYSSLFLVFNFLLQIDFQIFSGTGRPRQKMFVLLIGIGLNFFTNLILINMMGVYGAALATGIGWTVLWYLGYRTTGDEYHAPFDWYFFLKNFVTFTLLSVLIWLFLPDLYGYSRGFLFLCCTLVVAIYGIIFLLVNPKDVKEIISLVRIRKAPEK